jgi:hypothetical protein
MEKLFLIEGKIPSFPKLITSHLTVLQLISFFHFNSEGKTASVFRGLMFVGFSHGFFY